MKIGIVYGTRRKAATAEIVESMTERLTSLGHDVVCEKPLDFGRFDRDLYILGTAVYAFSAKRTGLTTFIRKNLDTIGRAPTALFVVCGADADMTRSSDNALKRALKNAFLDREKYLTSVSRLLPTAPVSTAFFKGYQEPEDREKINFGSQKERVIEWCDSLPALLPPKDG